jgi:hypothetical protein
LIRGLTAVVIPKSEEAMSAFRLAVTSDLHLPITPAATIADVARAIAAFGPHAAVIAGDIAESLKDLAYCLQVFRLTVSCPVWVLAGNHDVWARDARSKRLWQELLPESVREAGCNWLEGTAFVQEGVAVAGTIAWYDYSGADATVDATPAIFAAEKPYYNPDATLIDWEWNDLQFAALVAQPFLDTLDRLEADAAVRQTVVVTHVPVLECQMSRRPDNRRWAFTNAYFGNLTLGKRILQRPKVTHIVSGHTHVERHGRMPGADGRTVEAWVLGSDYRRPAWLGFVLDAS